MCTYNIKIYHQEDRSFHKVAHNVSREQKDHLVDLIEKHNKSVLIEFNTELDALISTVDVVKLVAIGIIGVL